MDGIIVENPIKIDDLGVALFLETPIYQTGGMEESLFFFYIEAYSSDKIRIVHQPRFP